jgi:hypothetical protein
MDATQKEGDIITEIICKGRVGSDAGEILGKRTTIKTAWAHSSGGGYNATQTNANRI